CDGDVVSHEVAYHVADLFEEGGADVWFERAPADLVPDGFACPHCGAGPEGFEKVEDILDVWFDSGVSWAAVLRDKMGVGEVADLYLEGSDQHRGWFQHALLPAVATTGSAPFKAVLTHGFVVDEKGHKYSKSSPNFEPLKHMIDQHGAEIMRLWVAMVDYRNDMVLA
ncbi:MAG: class I tRNA ligase family protein, partial [Halioglobus sp.]|nr:class I tRNA ligase family protein [Halioglobus sp.]